MTTEEAQYGGLIDNYWIFYNLIYPIFIILLMVLMIILIFNSLLPCPYTEDVSSCFPYNLPNWVKILLPFGLIMIPIIAIILMLRMEK